MFTKISPRFQYSTSKCVHCISGIWVSFRTSIFTGVLSVAFPWGGSWGKLVIEMYRWVFFLLIVFPSSRCWTALMSITVEVEVEEHIFGVFKVSDKIKKGCFIQCTCPQSRRCQREQHRELNTCIYHWTSGSRSLDHSKSSYIKQSHLQWSVSMGVCHLWTQV